MTLALNSGPFCTAILRQSASLGGNIAIWGSLSFMHTNSQDSFLVVEHHLLELWGRDYLWGGPSLVHAKLEGFHLVMRPLRSESGGVMQGIGQGGFFGVNHPQCI